jgi:hypothetical protein
MLVSANYFDLLGVKAAFGRTFSLDEDRQEGGNPVIVVTCEMSWRLFGGGAAFGRTVEFNALPYTVIGVMSPAFKGTLTVANPDLAFHSDEHGTQRPSRDRWRQYNERRMRMIKRIRQAEARYFGRTGHCRSAEHRRTVRE